MRLQKQTPGQSPANFFSFPSTICLFPVILPRRPICFGLLSRKQVKMSGFAARRQLWSVNQVSKQMSNRNSGGLLNLLSARKWKKK